MSVLDHTDAGARAAVLAGVLRGEPLADESARDIESLLATAADHGVEALVWTALEATASPRGAELRDLVHGSTRAAAARELLVQREVLTVLATLDAARVPAVVIKGSALAYTVYPHPWQRPRTDTDVLVNFEDVTAAAAALEASGYARTSALTSGTLVSHQVAFERRDARGLHHVVDVHWKIVNPQLLADTLTFDDLWRSRQAAPSLGAAAWVPSGVHSALLACIHRLAHHQAQDRLIWLYDVRLLVDRFATADWDAFTRAAIDRRVAGLCLDGLSQAHQRLGAELPHRVEAALRQAAPGEPSHRYLEGAVRRRDVLASDLSMLPSWKDRLRLLREHAFPPPDFMRERYGVRSSLLLPALYVHRLVTGAFKWVRP